MQPTDIHNLLAIQAEAYGDYFLESEDILEARFIASPTTAWLAWCSNQPVGYLVGYFSQVGKITPLNHTFMPSTNPDCLYLHDLALNKAAQGKGASRKLIQQAIGLAQSKNIKNLALISVQDSQDFWQHHGFNICAQLADNEKAHLETYSLSSQPAIYMIKQI